MNKGDSFFQFHRSYVKSLENRRIEEKENKMKNFDNLDVNRQKSAVLRKVVSIILIAFLILLPGLLFTFCR